MNDNVKEQAEEEFAATPNTASNTTFRQVIKEVLVNIIVIALTAAFCHFVITPYYIPSASMEPTLADPCLCIGWSLPYLIDDPYPNRGDIVVFRTSNPEKPYYVKRVIGLPGETIHFENGDVYINGELITEPYLLEQHSTVATGDSDSYTIPDGCVFVMGDNRRNSADSRVMDGHFVKITDIQSRILFK